MTWLMRNRETASFAASVSVLEAPRSPDRADLELRTQQIGRELLQQSRQQRAGVFSSRHWSDRLVQWAMKDEAFKVALFRFIDAFPTLQSPAAVHEDLVEYLSQPGVTLPPGMELGLKAGHLAKGMLARSIGHWIAAVAGNFIAGADAAAALPKLQQIWQRGMAFSVDILGETCLSRLPSSPRSGTSRTLVRSVSSSASKKGTSSHFSGSTVHA